MSSAITEFTGLRFSAGQAIHKPLITLRQCGVHPNYDGDEGAPYMLITEAQLGRPAYVTAYGSLITPGCNWIRKKRQGKNPESKSMNRQRRHIVGDETDASLSPGRKGSQYYEGKGRRNGSGTRKAINARSKTRRRKGGKKSKQAVSDQKRKSKSGKSEKSNKRRKQNKNKKKWKKSKQAVSDRKRKSKSGTREKSNKLSEKRSPI
ncbi:hypothetical protein Pmani_001565 [Petrolisthes manimaculis]|uniref:Uncharacterized protein n=1 Tax=Petrolisthes manimaculis TaxID=1843537 RepID=A0AAE1UK67_9EUCA|nr:hypothetical protein Pmani_001565 [Petrolisthes manimaculis]